MPWFQVQVGSHTFNMTNRAQSVREAEQRVACIALQGLCMMDSQSGYFPEGKKITFRNQLLFVDMIGIHYIIDSK